MNIFERVIKFFIGIFLKLLIPKSRFYKTISKLSGFALLWFSFETYLTNIKTFILHVKENKPMRQRMNIFPWPFFLNPFILAVLFIFKYINATDSKAVLWESSLRDGKKETLFVGVLMDLERMFGLWIFFFKFCWFLFAIHELSLDYCWTSFNFSE